MNANGQLIENLTRSGTFQHYARAYTEMTGLPLALRGIESWQLPFHGKPGENSFCALMAGQNHTCAACLQLQAKLALTAMDKPAAKTCAFGLREIAVPVKLGQQTIGFLQTGQVMRQKPTGASFHRAVVQALKMGVDIDNLPTKQAYFGTAVVSQRKLGSVTSLLAIFADHLAMKSNMIVMQAANLEPSFITRAKEFICEHYRENLSLHTVSNTVNTSRFYFCKQFRKTTGFGFTEFVSRLRIEKAKALLLNRNLRVSEIAYEIGFQSLTHFNRAFKKIIGQSPTEYRGTLPAAASRIQSPTRIRSTPHGSNGINQPVISS